MTPFEEKDLRSVYERIASCEMWRVEHEKVHIDIKNGIISLCEKMDTLLACVNYDKNGKCSKYNRNISGTTILVAFMDNIKWITLLAGLIVGGSTGKFFLSHILK